MNTSSNKTTYSQTLNHQTFSYNKHTPQILPQLRENLVTRDFGGWFSAAKFKNPSKLGGSRAGTECNIGGSRDLRQDAPSS